jgi:hypothetical protein
VLDIHGKNLFQVVGTDWNKVCEVGTKSRQLTAKTNCVTLLRRVAARFWENPRI